MNSNKTNEYYTTDAEPVKGFPAGAQQQQYGSQVPPFQIQHKHSQNWSTGLCSCTDDCGNCCMTTFCPCITFGRIAEIVDQGSTTCGTAGVLYALLLNFTGCQWIYSCSYRSKLRQQYSLQEKPCNDCLLHFCCESCALCQEYRELKNQGFDMKLGWHANMERRRQAQTFPPATQDGMLR